VVYANVVKDDTGRSKGWGIVEFETPEEVGSLPVPAGRAEPWQHSSPLALGCGGHSGLQQ